MISIPQVVATIKGFSLIELFSMIVATFIAYYLWTCIVRHYTNSVNSHVLCFLFSLFSTIGLVIIYVYEIVNEGKINIPLLILIIIFGIETYDEAINLYHCLYYKTSYDKNYDKTLGIKTDKDGMFNFIEEDGTTVPYKFLGAVSLGDNKYIVTLDEEDIENEKTTGEVLASIFEIRTDEDDNKFIYFDGVDDEDIMIAVLEKFSETNHSGYTFM